MKEDEKLIDSKLKKTSLNPDLFLADNKPAAYVSFNLLDDEEEANSLPPCTELPTVPQLVATIPTSAQSVIPMHSSTEQLSPRTVSKEGTSVVNDPSLFGSSQYIQLATSNENSADIIPIRHADLQRAQPVASNAKAAASSFWDSHKRKIVGIVGLAVLGGVIGAALVATGVFAPLGAGIIGYTAVACCCAGIGLIAGGATFGAALVGEESAKKEYTLPSYDPSGDVFAALNTMVAADPRLQQIRAQQGVAYATRTISKNHGALLKGGSQNHHDDNTNTQYALARRNNNG